MAYDNTDSGAIFKNEKKTNDRQPDMRGQLNAGGVEYWVAAWRKTSKAGKPYISIALTEKDEQPSNTVDSDPTDLGGSETPVRAKSADHPPSPPSQGFETSFDDDIPF